MKLDRIDVKPPLQSWKEILEQWVYLNEEIFKCANGNFAAYSYRERPNIGVIAGAAVKAGWVALEECWSEKEEILGVKNIYHGRADLWLWRDVHHERIEAKFTTDGFSELKHKIKRRHESAKNDAAKLGTTINARNIALTFIVPRVKHEEKEGFEKSVIELANHCMDLSPSLFASVFPGWVPRLGGDKNDEKKYAQGVIVIGDIVTA
jgi:hypothetical protein